jgi:hypothetical protein
MLTAYSTYHDIRAALGVSDEELDDATLSLQLFEDHLIADLDDIALNLRDVFSTVSNESSPTAAQTRFLSYVRLYSTYSVAKVLTTSLPLFSPKSVADGKAQLTRYENPYKDTVAAVAREYERWRSRLQAAFNELGGSGTTLTPRSYMSVVVPGTDPITNT